MNTRLLWLTLHLLAAQTIWCWPAIATAAQASDCANWPTSTSDLQRLLGLRAVEAAALAALESKGADDARLATFVARDADFGLGAGDVGRPLGKGSAGFRRLMAELQADRYRFDGWDYMSRQELPCGPHEVTVEFSSHKLAQRADVKFKFVDGRIVEAKGWLRSTTTGLLPAQR